MSGRWAQRTELVVSPAGICWATQANRSFVSSSQSGSSPVDDGTKSRELARLGHRVERWPDWIPTAGALGAIRADHKRGVYVAGADPRRINYAIAW